MVRVLRAPKKTSALQLNPMNFNHSELNFLKENSRIYLDPALSSKRKPELADILGSSDTFHKAYIGNTTSQARLDSKRRKKFALRLV